MAKYDPLCDYLARQHGVEAALTFDEVEGLVGQLPASSRVHRAWWANDSKVQATAWRRAGWRVRTVNLTAEYVIFARGVGGMGRPGGPRCVRRRRTSIRE